MRLVVIVLLLPALVLFGCDDGAPSDSSGSAIPECTPVPQATSPPVEGLVVPPGSHMYRAKPSGQKLTIVTGYVDMMPVAVRKFYEKLERDKRYEFFLLEDEVIEAEAFFTDGTWRNYVRALIDCEDRSKLYVLLAPEDYGDAVTPRPQTASP